MCSDKSKSVEQIEVEGILELPLAKFNTGLCHPSLLLNLRAIDKNTVESAVKACLKNCELTPDQTITKPAGKVAMDPYYPPRPHQSEEYDVYHCDETTRQSSGFWSFYIYISWCISRPTTDGKLNAALFLWNSEKMRRTMSAIVTNLCGENKFEIVPKQVRNPWNP